jgi:hypothetical protein
MAVDMRVVAVSVGLAVLVGGALATPAMFPAAFASEPQSHLLETAKDLFPAPKFDPKSLRKYDIDLNENVVSTEVTHRALVSKIGFGKRTIVSVVTTSTGTYSSDALVSPYVRYPGIDVTAKPAHFFYGGYGTPQVNSGVSTTPYGTFKWSSVTTGSFTFYSSNFERARRR